MPKFLILDRDGTINKDSGYVHRIKDLIILSGVVGGLKKFRDVGWKFIVITNQAGIAKGYYDTKAMHKFHTHLDKKLNNFGIKIEAFYFCPHHPDITGNCQCRKPNTLLVRRAAQKLGFKPEKCIFIGDKDSDIQLGKNCGGITVCIKNNQYENKIPADFRARNIKHAFELLQKAQLV